MQLVEAVGAWRTGHCRRLDGTREGCDPTRYACRAQFGWLIAVMAYLPMSDAEERTHFDPGYLAMVSPAALNQWLQGLNEWLEAGTGAQLVSIKVDEPSMVVAVVSVFAENRSQPIDPVTAGPVMLGAIKGAFTLAARR